MRDGFYLTPGVARANCNHSINNSCRADVVGEFRVLVDDPGIEDVDLTARHRCDEDIDVVELLDQEAPECLCVASHRDTSISGNEVVVQVVAAVSGPSRPP